MLATSVFAAVSELSGGETKAQRDSRLVSQLLCDMLKSEDAETVDEALHVIYDSFREDNTGYPQTIPEVITTLRRLLERPKDDEADVRQWACGLLGTSRARIAVPVLVEALADPYEQSYIEGVGEDYPAVQNWSAVWTSADQSLREITGANPVDAPGMDLYKGQREKVQAAWSKWYQANLPEPAKDKPELRYITITGGQTGIHGGKTGPIWAMINRDGSVMWTGFGPPYDDSAVKRFALTERLTEKMLTAAGRLGPQPENVKYFHYGGSPSCILVLKFKKGHRRILFTDHSKNDPSDTLRDLYRLLWKTRLAQLPGCSSTVATLAPHTSSAVVAVAEAEARITGRHSIHFSAGHVDSGDVEGGGTKTLAECRQSFAISEVLAGSISKGKLELAYAFNEEAEGFPSPPQEVAIPPQARVILLLGADRRILKAMPDTPENRKTVQTAVDDRQTSPEIDTPIRETHATTRQAEADALLARVRGVLPEGWEATLYWNPEAPEFTPLRVGSLDEKWRSWLPGMDGRRIEICRKKAVHFERAFSGPDPAGDYAEQVTEHLRFALTLGDARPKEEIHRRLAELDNMINRLETVLKPSFHRRENDGYVRHTVPRDDEGRRALQEYDQLWTIKRWFPQWSEGNLSAGFRSLVWLRMLPEDAKAEYRQVKEKVLNTLRPVPGWKYIPAGEE
jgi:hypothetical protein